MVISAAHSSRLILQNDEDSEDDNDSMPDETPNEEADDDETPEENVDDDGAPGDGSDEMFEEIDDIRDEDGSLEDHSQDNERLLSSSGTEIASDRTEHELVSQMKKTILETTHLMSILSELPSIKSSQSQPARSTHTCSCFEPTRNDRSYQGRPTSPDKHNTGCQREQ